MEVDWHRLSGDLEVWSRQAHADGDAALAAVLLQASFLSEARTLRDLMTLPARRPRTEQIIALTVMTLGARSQEAFEKLNSRGEVC